MSDEIVTVQQVSRVFGRTVALADVTLSVARGTVFGLVGENGAGKTTLIKHLLGLYRPEYGQVRVFGSDPVRDPVGVLGRTFRPATLPLRCIPTGGRVRAHPRAANRLRRSASRSLRGGSPGVVLEPAPLNVPGLK